MNKDNSIIYICIHQDTPQEIISALTEMAEQVGIQIVFTQPQEPLEFKIPNRATPIVIPVLRHLIKQKHIAYCAHKQIYKNNIKFRDNRLTTRMQTLHNQRIK